MADNYDPKFILMSFGSIQLQGLAKGTFVTAERDEDAFTKSVGSDGRTTRIRNQNRGGRVTVTLQAEAPANDLLSALARVDEQTGAGAAVLSITNINGGTLVEATEAWIMKLPAVEYSDGEATREWVFDCEDLEIHVAGAAF